jgi:predicted ester cyclase
MRKGSTLVIVDDNKALVRRYIEEVFNQRNLAAVETFLAPHGIDHTLPPTLPTDLTGTKTAIAMFLRAVPDLQVTLEDVVAEGDRVAVRYTSRGTQRGPFGPIPATGRPVQISSYLTARIADGKIVEMWGLDDQLGLLQQLGVIPALVAVIFLAGLAVGAGLNVLLRKARARTSRS